MNTKNYILLICAVILSCRTGNVEGTSAYISSFKYYEAEDISGIEEFLSNKKLLVNWESKNKKHFDATHLVVVLGNEAIQITGKLLISADTLYLVHEIKKTHEESESGAPVRVNSGMRYFRLNYSVKSKVSLDSFTIVSLPEYNL